MLIHLFRGTGRIFGCTADGSGANLPPKFGPWAPFKAIDIERGSPTVGVNSTECIDDVEQYGFHITDAHVRITEQAF